MSDRELSSPTISSCCGAYAPSSPLIRSRCVASRRTVEVPQQTNQSDCGLFLLKFVEYTLFTAPSTLSKGDIDGVSTDTAAKQRKPVVGQNGLDFLGNRAN
eukprot:1194667-Prorocentrum_minimum.AAC.1